VTQKVATHTMLFVYSASHFLHWLLSLLRVPLFGGPGNFTTACQTARPDRMGCVIEPIQALCCVNVPVCHRDAVVA